MSAHASSIPIPAAESAEADAVYRKVG